MKAQITLLPGDGVGPEVTSQATRVLARIALGGNHDFVLTEHSIGGHALDTHGQSLPPATLEACRQCDAILLGAVGGPLAFLAGERLGGVIFTDHTVGLIALAVGWAILMPLMMLAARRWNGFGHIGLPATAAAVAGN